MSEHSDLCRWWHGYDCDCVEGTVHRQESEISELINETNRLRANRNYWMEACKQAQEHRDGANASIAIWEAETVSLRAEIERLRADAERWRTVRPWFRVSSLDMGGQHRWFPGHEFGRHRGATIDDAVD